MKKKFLTIVSILIVITLAACGSAEPTMSAEDLASTALADAWLAITQTQAALPTATLIPPTNTPESTATFFPTLPPLPTLAPATVAAAPTTDVCGQIPSSEPKGTLANVEFSNQSEGTANFTFGMNSPNDQGECFNYTIPLRAGEVSSSKVLTGCYWGWAWIDGNEPSIARTGDLILCLPDSTPTYHVVITKETISLK